MSAIASNATVVGLFILTAILVLIYRQDTIRAGQRRDSQNKQWGIELAKVSGVLVTTQQLLEAQQESNKIILETNRKQAAQLRAIRKEVQGLRQEVQGLRGELKQMTARAEAAEDRID